MNTVLIEDERIAALHLQNLLRKHPGVMVLVVLPSVATGIEWLSSPPAPLDLSFSIPSWKTA